MATKLLTKSASQQRLFRLFRRWVLPLVLLPCLLLPAMQPKFTPVAAARSAVTPWTSEIDLQNLVYGASTPTDVQRILGVPDDIIRAEQMYPVVENYYYYDPDGGGAATVFVFESNLLAGLLFKSRNHQFVDLTYFLPNNGDRQINQPILGEMRGYYPNLPLYTW